MLPLEQVQLVSITDSTGVTAHFDQAYNSGSGECGARRRRLVAAAPWGASPHPMYKLQSVASLAALGPGRAIWLNDAVAELTGTPRLSGARRLPAAAGISVQLVIPAATSVGDSITDVTGRQQDAASALVTALNDAQSSAGLGDSSQLLYALSTSGFIDAYSAATGVSPENLAAAIAVSQPTVDVPSTTATGTPSSSSSPLPTFAFTPLAASPLAGGAADAPSSATFPGGAVGMGPGQGLLFAAYSFAGGRELWTLAPGGAAPATLAPGGAAPATLAWDVLPGGAGSEPSELTTLAAAVTGGAPAVLFAARAADGAAPTLHAWSAGADGLRCALALSTPVTSPLRPVVAAAGAFFVGTAGGADGSGGGSGGGSSSGGSGGGSSGGAPSLWLLPRAALTASALCAQGAPLPVSQPLPGVAPLSRVEHCGGKVVFLARGVGAHASASGAVGVYWLDAAAAGGADDAGASDAGASFTPLPEHAQPPAAPAGDLLPNPRCMAGGAVAFATAGGPVALVAPSGATTLLSGDAILGAYTGARALAPVGVDGGLCFVASVGGARGVLLCWTPAGGLTEARAGPTVDVHTVAWALGTPSGHVYLPCYGPDGSGPHACAYAPATRTWAATSGLEVPYSSFTGVGGQLTFAAAATPGGTPVLHVAALLAV